MDSQATNTRERVEVAEGAEPATAANDTPQIDLIALAKALAPLLAPGTAVAPRTLTQRMAAIRDESYGIGKDNIKMKSKAGVEFTIKGHTVEAVLAEMRPLLSRHGVDLSPNLVERTYTGNRCDILVDFEFENVDDASDRKVIRWAGAGTDDGDKGFSKAGTNALKEMLKKLFLITDRDDAKEETESVEHKTENVGAQKALQSAQAQRGAAIQQWAKTFKAALETAPTPADVDRLKRENKEQLESEDLPDVTRQFFHELIAERKAETTDAAGAQ